MTSLQVKNDYLSYFYRMVSQIFSMKKGHFLSYYIVSTKDSA